MQTTFWRAPAIADGMTKLEKNSAYRQIVEDGLRAQTDHGKLSDPGRIARLDARHDGTLAEPHQFQA